MAPSQELVSIAPMTDQDIEAVETIERLCFTTPWTRESLTAELQDSSSCCLVAMSGRDVVGHIGLWMMVDEAHIITLAVHPEHRQRKIGERLLNAGIAEGLRRGIRRMTLEVRSSNEAALRLYRKYGFAPIAVRKRYYEKEGEDAVVMWMDQMNTPEFERKFAGIQQTLAAVPESP